MTESKRLQLWSKLKNLDIVLPTVEHLTLDSRAVRPGSGFVALPGAMQHGAVFINAALAQGARLVLLAAAENQTLSVDWQGNTPIITVPGLVEALPELAACFYPLDPRRRPKLIACTGTNGKTSVCHYIVQMLQQLGQKCAVMGTCGSGIWPALQATSHTTVDILSMRAQLSAFQEKKVAAVALEASSHALTQQRLTGLPLDMGIFTNLSQDHLDYHGSMQAYAAAKQRLFTDFSLQHAVINHDDKMGRQISAALSARSKLWSYSCNKHRQAVVNACLRTHDEQGLSADINTPWGQGRLKTSLLGEFTLNNLLAAITAVKLLGFTLTEILDTLPLLEPVKGRLQVLHAPHCPTVVIDYAHTPDALQQVLQTVRPLCLGKLLCLFGCGGDRDRQKRALMGAVAERMADSVVLTNDNPRSESPQAIVDDILQGMEQRQRSSVILDRAAAISEVISTASEDDWLLIAGKGHEEYQEIAGKKHFFSDQMTVGQIFMEKTA